MAQDKLDSDHRSSRLDNQDANSTHFHSLSVGGDRLDGGETTDADAFTSPPVSIRLHSQIFRWSVVSKVAFPVILLVLLCLIVNFIVTQGMVSEIQMNAVRAKAYPVARMLGKYARVLLGCRADFLSDHPEYATATRWQVGNYWLLEKGFISASRWTDLVGLPLDQIAPVEVLEGAETRACLLDLSEWLADNDGLEYHEVVGAYILDASGLPVAASHELNTDPGGASPVLWRLPAGFIDANYAAIDSEMGMVKFDHISSRSRNQLFRAILPVYYDWTDPDVFGYVVAVFQTERQDSARYSFLVFLASVSAIFLVVIGLATWFSIRRLARPLRRLTEDMNAIAEGNLSRRSSLTGRTDEIGMLSFAFNVMAERLRSARVNVQEASRLDNDLLVARNIQNNLLPPQTPRIRGLDIHTSYRPAKEIGGDYFDFLPVDSNHMGLVVADASGKSIPAALVMTTTRAILRFVATGSLSAADTLTRVNSILSVDIPRGMFVTAYYVVYDPRRRSLVCASAGHNPLLLARANGSMEVINPGGIALGFDRGPVFQHSLKEQVVNLEKGDRFILYTDGVVECANIENEEYSERRLQEFLRRHRHLSSHDFVGALLADLDHYRGGAEIRDDSTIVTFKVV